MNKIRKPLVLNDFCLRQFNDSKNCSFINMKPDNFMNQLNKIYLEGLKDNETGDFIIYIKNIICL